MFSEYVVFLIDEIPMFILSDRWFPGTSAVGIASYTHSFFGFFVCLFSFLLMWHLMLWHIWLDFVTESLQHRSGSVGMTYRCFSFLVYRMKELYYIICKSPFPFKD